METTGGFQGQLWLMLIGIVFILVGCMFVYAAVRSTLGHIQSRNWPRIAAVLKDAQVVKRVREGDSDDNHRKYVSWFCEVSYDYSVGAHGYSASEQIKARDIADAAGLAARQPRGSTRLIYHDPERPEHYRFTLVSPLMGLVWLLPFLAFAGLGWAAILVAQIL